jgi:hypothetical protein
VAVYQPSADGWYTATVRVGLQAPELHPEQILLLRVVREARKGE